MFDDIKRQLDLEQQVKFDHYLNKVQNDYKIKVESVHILRPENTGNITKNTIVEFYSKNGVRYPVIL